MKKTRAGLDDLHYDLLKEILIRVAKSSSGAQDFARAISVCKAFRQFVEDGDVLRAVVFDDLLVSGRWHLFQLVEGLINRCAQAGDSEAQFILAKIILVSTSRLVDLKLENMILGNDNLMEEEAKLASFVENFIPDRNNLDTHASGFHFNLVRLFLSRARCSELQEMQPYINKYIEFFIGCTSLEPEPFLVKLKDLCSSSLEQKLEIFKNRFVEEIEKPNLDAYKSISILTLTEEQLCEMDVAGGLVMVRGWTHNDLLEKLDVTIKRSKHLRTVAEETYKAVQLSLGNAQFVGQCLSLLQEYYHVQVSTENWATDLQTLVSHFEDERGDLISKFDVLFLSNVNI